MTKRKRKPPPPPDDVPRETPETLEAFREWCAGAVANPPGDYQTLIFTEDAAGYGILSMGVAPGEAPDVKMVMRMMQGLHRFAGMATWVSWAPDDVTDYEDSWAMVCIELTRPALCAILFDRNGAKHWYAMNDPLDMPWFMAATAGSCRKMLRGERPVFKWITDERLYGRPGHGDPVPPVDKHGRI